jgi:uncharacterized repeat protein (TIGR01451 family)
MMERSKRINWLTLAVSTLLVLAGLTLTPNTVRAEPIPPEGNPNYFYDRETAFIVTYAIDGTLGGAYTAVDGVGNPVGDLPGNIWGLPTGNAAFAGNPLQGTDRSLFGQGTCIRWFITEYQRISTLGAEALAELNAVLAAQGSTVRINNARQLLTDYAASCADFVIDYMVIPDVDDGNVEDPYNGIYDLGAGETPDIGDVRIPGRVFYWTSVGIESTTPSIVTSRYVDDTLHQIAVTGAAPRAESIVAWSIAELANIMQAEGIPGSARFRNHAQTYWNWFFNDATPMPLYNEVPDPVLFPEDHFDAISSGQCPSPPNATSPNRCLVGGARDIFIPALGVALGQNAAAIAYANTYLGTGTSPDLSYPPPDTIQDSAYIAGYGRGIIFANLGEDDGNYWDFGNYPALQGAATGNWGDLASYPAIGNLNQPFQHFAGREILSGVQRAFWFYYTFGENPNATYPAPGTFADSDDMRDAILGFWNFANQQMWDTTDGVEAWFESTAGQYKPCFSAGTDLPIGDWRAPAIADKVHVMNPDGSATVEVSGVEDEPFPYMSWEFAGSGVVDVEVVYSIDDGATWITVAAVDQGNGLWTGDIPEVDISAAEAAGTTVYYYARAMDAFNNWREFPEGAEDRGTDGVIALQDITESQNFLEEEDDEGIVQDSGGSFGLEIDKTVAPGVVSIDQDVTWTIRVTNIGGSAVIDETIFDDIPDGLDILSTNTAVGTITVSGQTVSWFIPRIEPGETLVATIQTRVTVDVSGQVIINEVRGETAQIIIVTTLPATGERPWWAPCRWLGTCRDDE